MKILFSCKMLASALRYVEACIAIMNMITQMAPALFL